MKLKMSLIAIEQAMYSLSAGDIFIYATRCDCKLYCACFFTYVVYLPNYLKNDFFAGLNQYFNWHFCRCDFLAKLRITENRG